MNILVTGATGGLGFRTIERLAHNSSINKIIATGRSIKKSHFIAHEKVSYELGDLTDANFVDALVEKVDVIVHTAALSSPWGSFNEFYNANVKIVDHLLEASKKYTIKRIVFIGTPSIYFNFENRFDISEADPLPKKFVNHYAETKFLAEKKIKDSTIPFIILRPRALIGRGDRVIMPRMIRAHRENRLRIIGNGTNKVDLTSIANVTLAIENSLFATGNALNEVYNISNGKPVELWKIIDEVLKGMNLRPNKKKIPYSIAMFVAQFLEWKAKIGNNKEPSLTKYSVGILGKSFSMDISKAENLLNYAPETTVNTSVREFVQWQKELESNEEN